MPRKKIVHGENVVDAIRAADRPFVTTGDIADHLDVTPQAVRENANELAEYPELEKGKVAQSSVYWLSDRNEPPERVEETKPPQEPPSVERQNQRSGSGNSNGKGILERLFAGLPSFGDPLHVWMLAIVTAMLGLTLGVAVGIIIARPQVGVAIKAVTLVLALGMATTLPIALYYSLNHSVQIHGESA